MNLQFPVITEEDIETARYLSCGDITPVTICDCGVKFLHRLGCRKGHKVYHEFMHNGEIIGEFSPVGLNG